MNALIVLIPLLPLLGFLANGLLGRWLHRGGGWLAVLCMAASTVISLGLFFVHIANPTALPIQVTLWEWMPVGDLNLSLGFYVDQLTLLMLSFVTFVSTLVFLYSMGYMKGDPGFNRFFAYLSLFDFSMLVLVLGDSLPVLFIGWEGVGLCSYLLIGYYLALEGAPDAGKKAFIVNRIGDFGLLVAMFMLFWAVGSLDIQAILQAVIEGNNPHLVYGGAFATVVTLMIFLGCTGKSAQIPLFVWLPDAMAGPTPVSALIHAATMVTAGVYLVVRMSPLFMLTPDTLVFIAVIATLTAFVAGSIALTQRDIKKVLAYSTVSQLGYMFLACGVGAFSAGIFHVYTHAFFKACLFLGAGSVIHAAHEQDIFRLGGIKRWMPATRWTFLIGCLGLAGAPPLAGFISKDEILWKAFSAQQYWLWGLGLLTAFFTAFYSFRLYFLTFEGKCRLPEKNQHHMHESPATMTWPLILLAVGTIFVGLMNLPAVVAHGELSFVNKWLHPVTNPAVEVLAAHAHGEHAAHHGLVLELGLMALSVALVALGIALAWFFSLKGWPERTGKVLQTPGLNLLYRISYTRWMWDDFYNYVVAGGLVLIAKIATLFDRWIIDGLLHTIAAVASSGSRAVREIQNGQVQAYALMILLGVNLIILLMLFL